MVRRREKPMPPDSMIDIEEVADILDIPPHQARIYLEARDEPPVAVYHGRALWYADTVQDILAGA